MNSTKLLLTLVTFVAVLSAVSCEKASDGTTRPAGETAKEAAYKAGDAIEKGAVKTGEALKTAAQKTGDVLEKAANDAGPAIDSATTKTKEIYQATTRNAGPAISKAGEKIKQASVEVGQAAKSGYEQARDTINPTTLPTTRP